jgi:hypothetical protein
MLFVVPERPFPGAAYRFMPRERHVHCLMCNRRCTEEHARSQVHEARMQDPFYWATLDIIREARAREEREIEQYMREIAMQDVDGMRPAG